MLSIVLLVVCAQASEPVSVVAMNGPVSKIEFSRDGRFVAVGGMQGDIAVYDASSWSKAHSFKPGSSRITDLGFSPDSSLLAVASQDKSIRILKRSGEAVHKFDSAGWGMSVSFSPDGARLAGAFADGILRVWNAASGAQTWSMPVGAKKALHVRWHPKANRIAITDASGWVAMVDATNGKELGLNKSHAGTPQFISFSNDGSALLASMARGGNPPALALIDPATMTTKHNFESLMSDGFFTPDGSKVVGLGGDGDLRVFDVSGKKRDYKGNPISKIRFFKPDRMTLSPDGKQALITGDMQTGFGFYVVPVDSLK